jgi:hypothetical protein
MEREKIMDEGSVALVIGSSPYASARVGNTSGAEHVGHHSKYGSSDGQLGSMVEGEADAVITSPPFVGVKPTNQPKESYAYLDAVRNRSMLGADYGSSDGQLGSMPESDADQENFWSEARVIVEQAYAALKPGGVAVWVTKSYVRAGRIIDFPDAWRRLCEACGFETFAMARAWLVEDQGTQYAMDGNHRRYVKSRKGFFRRINEKKFPGTEINFETVLFMRKAA